MTNTCSVCGANLALVGWVHNCRPRVETPRLREDVRLTPTTEQPTGVGQPAGGEVVGTDPARLKSATYKYRDPDKWRAYMRDYMRKKRATC